MSLPDLDDLIAEVDRTCATAGALPGEPDQPDWMELLATAAGIAEELRARADDLVADYVEHCRMHGRTWAEIGAVLGVTRQAAQQRFLAAHRRYTDEEFAAELRTALAEVKQVAVRHRNNYIGTEHLLSGLLAADNTATRLLGARTEEVRARIADHLSLGASQAAERIAFTPYARKTMELARVHAGENPITCADVLTALVQVHRGAAARVLAESGFTPESPDAPSPA